MERARLIAIQKRLNYAALPRSIGSRQSDVFDLGVISSKTNGFGINA